MKSIFISIGEYSGDLLAADLVRKLRNTCSHVDIYAVTGPALKKEKNIIEIASIDELSTMSMWEIVKKFSYFKMYEKYLLEKIDRIKPQLVILIDFFGFHQRLASQIHLRGIKVVQYVAPKLWAWGHERAIHLREDFSEVFGILPFEEKFFKSYNIPYKYIGSPIYERIHQKASKIKIQEHKKWISFLPGSRQEEIKNNMPLIFEIRQQFAIQHGEDFSFFILRAANISEEEFKNCLSMSYQNELRHFKIKSPEDHTDTLLQSSCAVVTSGTAVLEVAFSKIPQLVIYRMHPLSYQLAINKLRIKWVNLCNIILNKEVLKEFIQEINIKDVVDEMSNILFCPTRRKQIENDYAALDEHFCNHPHFELAHEISAYLQ